MDRVSVLLKNNFPLGDQSRDKESSLDVSTFQSAIDDWLATRASIKVKYWSDWSNSVPNFLNSDHMTLFLYFLSKNVANQGSLSTADQISYLNKIRNGIDLWHSISLPRRTLFVHPIGTVLGRAEYADKFVCYQNVTVGASQGIYPVFRGSCILYSGVSILGASEIGDNVVVGAGTHIINKRIPSNSKVYFKENNLVIKSIEQDISEVFFK